MKVMVTQYLLTVFNYDQLCILLTDVHKLHLEILNYVEDVECLAYLEHEPVWLLKFME